MCTRIKSVKSDLICFEVNWFHTKISRDRYQKLTEQDFRNKINPGFVSKKVASGLFSKMVGSDETHRLI